MLDKIIYRNHNGKELKLGESDIYVNSNDLRDFSWDYTTKNNRISSFKRGVVKKTIPLIIKSNSEEQAIEIKNSLFELAEADVLTKEYGWIIIGDYYLRCFVTASKKSNYLIDKCMMNVSIEVTTDLPMWVSEKKFSFTNVSITSDLDSGIDYKHDCPFDYFKKTKNKLIENDNFASSDFEIIIYGSCENPEIIIGDYIYSVQASLLTGEYIVINSVTKKIYMVKNDGEKINMFHFRSKDIFRKIPKGTSTLTWNGFGFDITLLQERSEPKWI